MNKDLPEWIKLSIAVGSVVSIISIAYAKIYDNAEDIIFIKSEILDLDDNMHRLQTDVEVTKNIVTRIEKKLDKR